MFVEVNDLELYRHRGIVCSYLYDVSFSIPSFLPSNMPTDRSFILQVYFSPTPDVYLMYLYLIYLSVYRFRLSLSLSFQEGK